MDNSLRIRMSGRRSSSVSSGLMILRVLLGFVVILGILSQSPPIDVDLDSSNLPLGKTWRHPFGCDRLGRDVYAMFSYGILSTVLIAIPARIFTLGFSVVVALVGFGFGEKVRFILDQTSYVFLSIPSLLIALLVTAGLGANFFSLPIAILLSDWAMSYESLKARLREIEKSGYVTSAYAMGGRKFHVFRRHVFPGLISMLWYLFITGVPTVIMALAIFSFLGVDWSGESFGPGLGEQIAFSGDYYDRNPFAVIMPILGIVLLVIGLGKK